MSRDAASWPRHWAIAHKAHRCRGCHKAINPGDRYWRVEVPFVPAAPFCSSECDERALADKGSRARAREAEAPA